MKTEKQIQGKKNRAAGQRFERKVRADLEKETWIVSKWQNNIKDNKCVPAKMGKFRTNQSGFPDFIVYRINHLTIFVESKVNGYLDKIEREKAKWYLKNNYCNVFVVASKGKQRGSILYKRF